jgi:hypothetical protein
VELELRASRVTDRRRLRRSASGLADLVACVDAYGDAAFDWAENVSVHAGVALAFSQPGFPEPVCAAALEDRRFDHDG